MTADKELREGTKAGPRSERRQKDGNPALTAVLSPGAIHHQELVFEQKGLGNEGTDAASLEQQGQDGD